MPRYATYEEPVLRFERRLHHPVDAVWRAVAEPEQLGRWFPTLVRGAMVAGAPLLFEFAGGEGPDDRGRVLEHEPPALLAFTWFGDVLRFELFPDGSDATVLRFSHELGEIDAAARTAAGWTVCLDRFEQLGDGVATAPPSGEPTDEWRAHYEHYVAAGVPHGAPVPGDR